MTTLGKLIQVPLRQVWESESSDFTPWVAEASNLATLGDALGIELELEAQEQGVGPFRADLLCKDTVTDHWVLIENQLARTDHSHLGQLLTYAAGLQAVTIVWIAERFTEEHRAALDWLNDITNERFNFFGVQVELWRIGTSEVAPRFAVISKPNGWTKSVQQAAQATSITPAKQLQLEFWTAFSEYMESQDSPIRCQKPLPQVWTNHPIGRKDFWLASVLSTWDSVAEQYGGEIRAELVIRTPQAKQHFAKLHAERATIEAETGFPLIWDNGGDRKQAKIYVRNQVGVEDRSLWPSYFEWLRAHLESLHRAFSGRIRALA